MTENQFRSHFSPFQINTQLIFSGNVITKCPPATNLDDRKSLSITFLAISDQYATFIFLVFFKQNHFRSHFSPFQINTQLSFFWNFYHFRWQKIIFDCISHHFISICNFYFLWFFLQNGRRRPFWMTETFIFLNFLPFWMTENHFRSYFSPFHIVIQLLFFMIFFTKWPPAAILDDRKSLPIAFLALSDQYTTSFFYSFLKMAASGHFGYPIFAKIDRDLPL